MGLIHDPVKCARAVRVIGRFNQRAVRDGGLAFYGRDVLLAGCFIVREVIAGKPVVIIFGFALRPDLRGS